MKNIKFDLRIAEAVLLFYSIVQLILVSIGANAHQGELQIFYAAAALFLILISVLPVPIRFGRAELSRIVFVTGFLFLFYRMVEMEQAAFGFGLKDDVLSDIEFGILGFHPSFVFQNMMETWLNELSYFAYGLGIISPVLAAIVITLSGKREQYESFLAAIVIACCISFMITVFFPVVGPAEGLEDIYYLGFYGGFFTQLIQLIIEKISVASSSFPAIYFGLMTISVLYLWEYGIWYRITSFAAMTAVFWGGVYLRFHYLADGIIALLIAYLAVLLDGLIRSTLKKRSGTSGRSKKIFA